MAKILADIYVALTTGVMVTKRLGPIRLVIATLTKLTRRIYYRDPLLHTQQTTVDMSMM